MLKRTGRLRSGQAEDPKGKAGKRANSLEEEEERVRWGRERGARQTEERKWGEERAKKKRGEKHGRCGGEKWRGTREKE